MNSSDLAVICRPISKRKKKNMSATGYAELYRVEAERITALYRGKPAVHQNTQAIVAAQDVLTLPARLGTDGEVIKRILKIGDDTVFNQRGVEHSLVANPERMFRFGLLRLAADAVTRKCGDDATARIWWNSANKGEPFAGQVPMRYLAEATRPEALLTVSYALQAER